MTPLFKKMNFKGHDRVVVLNQPEEFKRHYKEMQPFAKMTTNARAKELEFVLLFAKTQKEVDQQFAKVKAKLSDDVHLWIAFPKKSSKKYKSEINRDSGWAELGKAEFEGVKIVAIDENWSALRFRRVKHIKTLKRSEKMMLSKAGLEKKRRKN